jgi:hypothetical protein
MKAPCAQCRHPIESGEFHNEAMCLMIKHGAIGAEVQKFPHAFQRQERLNANIQKALRDRAERETAK